MRMGTVEVQIIDWICTMTYWTCVHPHPVDMNTSLESRTRVGQVLHLFPIFFLSSQRLKRFETDGIEAGNSLINLVKTTGFNSKIFWH